MPPACRGREGREEEEEEEEVEEEEEEEKGESSKKQIQKENVRKMVLFLHLSGRAD